MEGVVDGIEMRYRTKRSDINICRYSNLEA